MSASGSRPYHHRHGPAVRSPKPTAGRSVARGPPRAGHRVRAYPQCHPDRHRRLAGRGGGPDGLLQPGAAGPYHPSGRLLGYDAVDRDDSGFACGGPDDGRCRCSRGWLHREPLGIAVGVELRLQRDAVGRGLRWPQRSVQRAPTVAAACAGHQRIQLSAAAVRPRTPGARLYRTSRWSTRIDLVVAEASALVGAVEVLHRQLDLVEVVASRFRPDSELCVLHRAMAHAGGRPVPVSPLLAEAVEIGLRAGALTDGAVDITVGAALARLGYDRDIALLSDGVDGTVPDPHPLPGWRNVTLDREAGTVAAPPGVVIDLGSTAKAWAADRAAQAIGRAFSCGVLVSLGGDIAVSDAPPGGFTIGIADDCDADGADATVSIATGGLATSGVGRRSWTLGGEPVHHLVDPSTGLPVETPWRTVSVAAATCIDANTASTAAMVIGASAVDWLGAHSLPSRLVGRDGSVVTLADWPGESEKVPG